MLGRKTATEGGRDCSWVDEVTQNVQLKEALRVACAKGLTLENFAMMTPMEVEALYGVDSVAAERAIREARELSKDKIGSGIIVRKIDKEGQTRALKTGIEEFDKKTPWGGLPFGKITIMAGEHETGKSIFAMQVAASALSQGLEVAYINTEDAFNEDLFSRIAKRFKVSKLDRISIIPVADVYELETLIREQLQPAHVIIVDSIIKPFIAKFKGRKMLQERQQSLHYLIDLLRRRCVRFNALVLLTDNVVSEPSAADVKRPAGGNVLLHSANAIFMMVRPSKQKPEGYIWPLDVPGMSPEVQMRYEIRDDGLH